MANRRRRGAGALTISLVVVCLGPALTSCDHTGNDPLVVGGAAHTSVGTLLAPGGYSSRQLIFDDQFSGTGLDTTRWNTYIGAQGQIWNNFGHLPTPYSGPNTPITNEAAMFGLHRSR